MKKLDIILGIILSMLTFYVYAEDVDHLQLDPIIIEAEAEDEGCQQNPDGSAVGALVALFLGAYFVGFLVGKTDREMKDKEENDLE